MHPGHFLLPIVALALTTFSGPPAQASERCGEIVELESRGEKISYSFRPHETDTPKAALVLLAGGHGFLNLDENGCARKLSGNTLVRNQASLGRAGFATAVVDAPTDYQGKDGLGGFRADPDHAKDLSLIISDIRERTKLPIYVVGISRGTISAANAAVRLTGDRALAGTMLFSPVTSGREGAHKAWFAQTVFDLPLQNITGPLAVVVHRDDKCVRTPPALGAKVIERAVGTSGKLITVDDGSDDNSTKLTVKACKGKEPHGFGGQDKEVLAIITGFVNTQN